MTFGFFSSRGRLRRLVSILFIPVSVFTVGKTAAADPPPDAAPAAEADKGAVPDAAEADDAFFAGLDLKDVEDEGYESVVVGRRVRVTDETSGFAETIDLRDTAERMTTAADVLSHAGGVQVRRTGGIGSSASLGIRGSTSRQVPILLDGVEIGGSGSTAVDLGDFSLDLFDSLEVYRGAAPISVGESGIGGAVCLRTVPLTEPFTRVSSSAGSFGTERLAVGHGTPLGDLNALAVFTALHTDGDFPYLNRNGTPYSEVDDHIERRANNALTSYGALLKLGGPLKTWKWRIHEVLFAKKGGVPGVESVQTKAASAAKMRNQLTAGFSGPIGARVQGDIKAGYTYLSDELRDPLSEFTIQSQADAGLNLPAIHIAQTHTVPVDGTFRVSWRKAGVTDFSLNNRFERLLRREYGGGNRRDLPEVTHDRFLFGLGHRWKPVEMLSLDPALRFHMDSSRHETAGADSRVDTFWSPSLGIKLDPNENLTLRASVGRFVRIPDLDELYGAFGTIVGNPSLTSETAINADAGISAFYATRHGLKVNAQVAWYCSYAEDLIVYEQNSQHTIRPENVGKAVIQGAETGFRLTAKEIFSLELTYTYLYAVNRSDIPYYNGKRLPGRPAHRAYGKIEVGDDGDPVGGRFWLDADVAGKTYLNQFNQPELEMPARWFLGVGYRLSHKKSGTSLTLEVHNALNQMASVTRSGLTAPVADYMGFPLPGREIFLTFAWKG